MRWLARHLGCEPTREAVTAARDAVLRADHVAYTKGLLDAAGVVAGLADEGYPQPPIPADTFAATIGVTVHRVARLEPWILERRSGSFDELVAGIESDATEAASDPDSPSERERLRTALEVLRQHTGTPDDCYFCLWDGWGSDIEGDASPPTAPAFPPSVLDGPKVVIPHRAYFLFRGSLSELGDWGAADRWPGEPRLTMPNPAFVWPADQMWCIANDVDPHYAGIGADATAIGRLLAHPDLDVVAADPGAKQPEYY